MITMSDLREMCSARVLPVVKAMLTAEAQSRGVSVGQLLDDIVLASCRSAQAVSVLRNYAAQHPLVQALADIDTQAQAAQERPTRAQAPPKRKAS